jgi:hypothetical protein
MRRNEITKSNLRNGREGNEGEKLIIRVMILFVSIYFDRCYRKILFCVMSFTVNISSYTKQFYLLLGS